MSSPLDNAFRTDAAHGGSGWLQRKEVSPLIATRFGADSEWGTLKRVLLHRPGAELDAVVNNLDSNLWSKAPEIRRIQAQWDAYADLLVSHGISVELLAPRNSRPNHLYVRDLFVMTPVGAIVSRMASEVRAGEEFDALRALVNLDVPILGVVAGLGVFEGPDVVFIDSATCLVGTGIRSNAEGVRQVRSMLSLAGIESIRVETTYGCGHLDGVLSILNSRTAMVIPTRISHVAVDALRARNFRIIELTDHKEICAMAINVVCLDSDRIVLPSDCPLTAAALRHTGFEVIELAVDALRAGGGSLHCMTGIIARDKCPEKGREF